MSATTVHCRREKIILPTYLPAAPGDGSAWDDGTNCARRVLCGGSFGGSQSSVRCASRLNSAPVFRFYDLGFRIVLSPFL